jgi:hypothetical protein
MPSCLRLSIRPPALFVLVFGVFLSSTLFATYEELLYSNDFANDTVGEKPGGFDHLRPLGPNLGADEPFPVAWKIENGPVGALVVGESTSPAASLPGSGNKSLRIYDYTSGGSDPRAYVGKNFVPNSTNNRYDVRVDLRFKRSVHVDPFANTDRLLIALGGFATGQSFNQVANRPITISLTNHGVWQVEDILPAGVEAMNGFYDADGVNDLTIVANAHPVDNLAYDGPLGAHILAPYTYSLYLNNARVADGIGFRHEMPLGKLGFVTGFGNSDAEIDFLVDDIEVIGLREMEFVPFAMTIDFEDQTVGGRPAGMTRVVPGINVGATDPLPLTSASNGPVGTVVVGENSSPVPSINGRSVRLYDYTSDNRSKLSKVFVEPGEVPFPQVRFDFTFRRSLAMADAEGNPGQGLIVGLGEASTAQNLHNAAGRALEVRMRNSGRFRVAGESQGDDVQIEPFAEIGTHEVSIFANAQDTPVEFSGPDEKRRTLLGYSFSVFLNGELFAENQKFRYNFPALGKFAFVTGQGIANTDIDFVVDDIRISDFAQRSSTATELPMLRIARGATAESIVLSFVSSVGVVYGLQHSGDLITWTTLPESFTGDGSLIQHSLNTGSAPRGFYRLIGPGDSGEPGTPAPFIASHQVRMRTTNDADPDLIGVPFYTATPSNVIGKSGTAGAQRAANSIQGFYLPTLDQAPAEATYTIAKTGHNGNPNDWSAQIYIFEPQVTPEMENAADVFWSGSIADPRSLARPLALNAFDIDTANGNLSFTLTSADLAGFYNPDGTPASANGMIWFRVNPGKPHEEINNFERFEAQSEMNQPNSPTLKFSKPQ